MQRVWSGFHAWDDRERGLHRGAAPSQNVGVQQVPQLTGAHSGANARARLQQAFGSQLNDVDMAAVITYQRNAFGNNMGDMVQPIDVYNHKKG